MSSDITSYYFYFSLVEIVKRIARLGCSDVARQLGTGYRALRHEGCLLGFQSSLRDLLSPLRSSPSAEALGYYRAAPPGRF